MSWQILNGDVRDRLAELEDGSIQTCVTSPPYWGLRDYGTASWDGGDPECDHVELKQQREQGDRPRFDGAFKNTKRTIAVGYRSVCGKCGATRIDSQLGLEATPEEYVANMVEAFREVRRALRDDGTLWLNLGDSYATGTNADRGATTTEGPHVPASWSNRNQSVRRHPPGLKAKDLVGIPWMVAFALRADGWYLRSDIIWNKPNPMPESVTDRPTKAHEYLFLLAKSPRYFYDSEAIRESDQGRASGNGFVREHRLTYQNGDGTGRGNEEEWQPGGGRNRRSVWTVTTKPFPGAHFATFPPDLIEPCILAGSPPKCCGECGAPWERVTETTYENPGNRTTNGPRSVDNRGFTAGFEQRLEKRVETKGWRSTCDHDDDSARSTVLDPFAGAGTTGLVALRHDRDFLGIELNPDYAEMARNRIRDDAPLLNVEAA